MPARHLINLLPQDNFTASSAGRFLLFFLTIGRYVVIFTELVVILAFITSLILNHQKENLDDEIHQKILFLDANKEFEQEFRFTQDRLSTVNYLLNNQFGAKNFIDQLTPLISSDIVINKITLTKDTVQLTGSSRSILGLEQTLFAFKNTLWLSEVTITNVSTNGNTGGQIHFSLNAHITRIPNKGGSS